MMVRIEERFPTSVPVYLASWGEPRVRERTVAENVSPHGARVVSRRAWRPGDGSLVTPLTGEFLQRGTGSHCLPKRGERFSGGVELADRWGKRQNYAIA